MSPTKIMVVEDELILAQDLRAHLEKQGYQVTSLRATGEDALEAALEERPDLVLMDIVLAGEFDGVETAEKLREAMGVPVVFLTAYSDQKTIERAKATQPLAYILKPVDGRELSVTMELAVYKARMAAKLKKSEELHRTLMNNTNEGILVIQEGAVKFANQRMVALSGYSAEDLAVMPIKELIHPADRAMVQNLFKGWDENHPPEVMLSFRAVTADGATRWVETNQARIDWQDSPALLLFFSDITERKQLETQMMRNHKLQSLAIAAGGAAHDYNNILMGILGSSEMILEELEPESHLREEVESIRNLANRAVELTRRIAEFTGKVWVNAQNVNLNQVLRECETIARVSLLQGAGLELDLEPDLPEVKGNAPQLQQVALALISNAAESLEGKPDGKVLVCTRSLDCDQAFLQSTYIYEEQEPGGYVMLEVVDNGSGIAESDRERLFDPFFTTKLLGRGLGLATVLGIVRAMKGAIEVESETGQGSSLRLYLPRAPDQPA